jgi:hypothetical protein
MKWAELFYVNEFGESIADDVSHLAVLIKDYVERRGAELYVDVAIQILKYIKMRHGLSRNEIGWPTLKTVKPAGWTSEHEDLWDEWLANCSLESWIDEVMLPYFGTGCHIWEGMCEGWRWEIHQFLPWWVRRSPDLVAVPEYDEEEEQTVDAYILDHGSAKQKRAAGLER